MRVLNDSSKANAGWLPVFNDTTETLAVKFGMISMYVLYARAYCVCD
jgi:hypothetical protein